LLDKTIYQNKEAGDKYKSLLCGTHLMSSLNLTVELPPFVNHFDFILESRCRQKCMDILGEVSFGKINPIEGLNRFLKMMHDDLTDLKHQAEQKTQSTLLKYSLTKEQIVDPKLVDLTIQGALSTTFSYQTQTAADDYIQLLLRMTPKEKKMCLSNEKGKEKLYLEKIIEMQSEILQAKSSPNLR
jgi:hypothetical protein